jgi:hypothetical protein
MIVKAVLIDYRIKSNLNSKTGIVSSGSYINNVSIEIDNRMRWS